MTVKKYCPLHTAPGKAAELGSKGGRRRAMYSPDGLKDVAPPKTAADLRDLVAQSIVEVRAGKMEPRLANTISFLGTSFLRALHESDLEQRLAALES
jgi:hypothetical protein